MEEEKFLEDLQTANQLSASNAVNNVNELITNRRTAPLIPDEDERPDSEGLHENFPSQIEILPFPVKMKQESTERFLNSLGQLVVHVDTYGDNCRTRHGSGNILIQLPTIENTSGRRCGVIYVKTTSNMIQSIHEEQNCRVTIFYKAQILTKLRPKQVLRSNVPEDLLITLICETMDTRHVDLILEAHRFMLMMLDTLKDETKEALAKHFCILVQSYGQKIVVRVEEFNQANYGITDVINNGRREATIRRIEQRADAHSAYQSIRKALLYKSGRYSCGSPIVKLKKNLEGFSLDIWTHYGVDRSLDIGISTFKVLNFEDMPIPKWPVLPQNEMGYYSEVISRRVAHPALRDVERRLRTLQSLPQLTCSAAELAKGGFFYSGQGNQITCFECGHNLRIPTRPTRPNLLVLHCYLHPPCRGALQYMEDLLQCCVCQRRRISSLVFPCQHLKMCNICSVNKRRCPACNQIISHRTTVSNINIML